MIGELYFRPAAAGAVVGLVVNYVFGVILLVMGWPYADPLMAMEALARDSSPSMFRAEDFAATGLMFGVGNVVL